MKCLECFIELKNIKALITHLRYHHKSITSKDYYDKYIKKKNEGICYICKKGTKYISISKGYREYCSVSCVMKDPKTQEKIKNTCVSKFGVDNATKVAEIVEKRGRNNVKKWGASNPMNTEEGKVLRQKGFDKRYEEGHPMRSAKVLEKVRKTCNEKYKVNYYCEKAIQLYKNRRKKEALKVFKESDLLLLNIYKNNTQKIHKVNCLKCNNIFETCVYYLKHGYGRCPRCYPKYKSVAEHNIVEFIKNLEIEVVENSREIIKPYEIDIYIPSKKIAIEYNRLYWHSEICGKDRNYHLNKLSKCLEKDIRLIQIFEDEYLFKKDIVLNRLKQILCVNVPEVSNNQRIHARKCKIEEIGSKIKNEFLEKYHLQGQDKASVKLGAFYGKDLISVMTFSKGNIAKGNRSLEGVWELNRFCSNYDYRIPGVASKLLTYFKKNYEWKEIFSYADRRWSVGNLYYLLGFSLEKCTQPNYWYFKGKLRLHRFNLRKRLDEPEDVPEYFLRLGEGYQRIWDCGHLKFALKNRDYL